MSKPWARLRKHGPCMIFDWHETEALARQAIAESAEKNGEQVHKIQTVAFFPDEDPEQAARIVGVLSRGAIYLDALKTINTPAPDGAYRPPEEIRRIINRVIDAATAEQEKRA